MPENGRRDLIRRLKVNFFLLMHPFPICSKTIQWLNTRYFTEFTCSPNFLSVLYFYFPYVFCFLCHSFIGLPVDSIWYTLFLQHVPFFASFSTLLECGMYIRQTGKNDSTSLSCSAYQLIIVIPTTKMVFPFHYNHTMQYQHTKI